jgi:hypothetical protein
MSQNYGSFIIGIKFMHVTSRGSSNFQGQVAGYVRADRLYLKWKANIKTSKTFYAYVGFFPLSQCHHISLINFMVSPPSCSRSVTHF